DRAGKTSKRNHLEKSVKGCDSENQPLDRVARELERGDGGKRAAADEAVGRDDLPLVETIEQRAGKPAADEYGSRVARDQKAELGRATGRVTHKPGKREEAHPIAERVGRRADERAAEVPLRERLQIPRHESQSWSGPARGS